MTSSWKMVADIGGSNARFGLVNARGLVTFSKTFAVADFPMLEEALNQFLSALRSAGGWAELPTAACFALACPIQGQTFHFTNSPWQVVPDELAAALGLDAVAVINDFAAIGYAVTELAPADWVSLGGGDGLASEPVGVLGAGTGLGVCSVIPARSGWQPQIVAGEGGHVDFAPQDDLEVALYRYLASRYGHVSVERILSGPGILETYRFLSEALDKPRQQDSAEAISMSALAGGEVLATETLALFCRVLGSAAGNLALTLGARGGVYIAGGIVPQILGLVQASECRKRFEDKGRFARYLADIPLRVITRDQLGLLGAGAYLRYT